MISSQMKRLKSWMIRLLQGPAKSSPPEGVEEQLREDHPDRWKVGDEIVGIPLNNGGWVYIDKATAEYVGIELLGQLNKSYGKVIE